jgi:hypothetical protein
MAMSWREGEGRRSSLSSGAKVEVEVEVLKVR